MTRDSSTVSVRMRNDDIKKLKASGYTASQVLHQFIETGFTPQEEKEEYPVDLSEFLRMCERRKKNPQSVIDMITEQLASM